MRDYIRIINENQAMSLADQLEEYISTVVNDGYLDDLSGDGLITYAKQIDPEVKVTQSNGRVAFNFTDGTTGDYES